MTRSSSAASYGVTSARSSASSGDVVVSMRKPWRLRALAEHGDDVLVIVDDQHVGRIFLQGEPRAVGRLSLSTIYFRGSSVDCLAPGMSPTPASTSSSDAARARRHHAGPARLPPARRCCCCPRIAAGGDTPCHYPTLVYFHEHLLPHGRLHGWYPGAYLGHPLLLYYFPLPFLIMSALAPLPGPPGRLQAGTALGGVFLLPLLTYASFRLMGFRFPGPLLGAAAALVFLLRRGEPHLGRDAGQHADRRVLLHLRDRPGRPLPGRRLPRLRARRSALRRRPSLLAVTALAHGYAVCGRACPPPSSSTARAARGGRSRWLAAVAGLAFALAALLPGPAPRRLGLDDALRRRLDHHLARATCSRRSCWPLFVAALVGLVATLVLRRRCGGADHRLLFLAHAALVGAGPRRRRARPRHHRRALRALRPARAGAGWRGRASGSGAGAPCAAGRLAALGVVLARHLCTATPRSRVPALLGRLELHGAGGQGAAGRPSATWPSAPRDGGRPARGGRVQHRAREGRLHPHVRDAAATSRGRSDAGGRVQPGQPA